LYQPIKYQVYGTEIVHLAPLLAALKNNAVLIEATIN